MLVRAVGKDSIMNAARILLVDDDPATVGLFSKALRTAGYDVCEAATGQQCLQLTRKRPPDLVLLAVKLPDLNGIEVCRQIKSDPALQEVLVVLISRGPISAPDRIQGLEAGAENYILKPADPDELIARIRTVARLQQATAALRASERHHRRLVEILPDAVCLIDPQGRLLAANPQAALMLDYANPADLLGKSVFDLALAEQQERIHADLAATLQTGAIRNAQYMVRSKRGRCFPIELSAGVLTDANNQPVGLLTVGRDITERKKAEKQISAFLLLGHRLSGASTQEQAAGIILDIASELLGWDAGFVHLHSAPEDKIIPVLTVDTVGGQRTPYRLASSALDPSPLMRLVMREGSQLINRNNESSLSVKFVPFGDTTRRSLSLMFVPIHSGAAVVGILSIQSYQPQAYSQDDLALLQTMADRCGDALLRIEVAEAFRKAEAKYRSIFENAVEGILVASPEGRPLSINPAGAQMFGYASPEEFISSITDLGRQLYVDPERREKLKRLLETEGSVKGFEAEFYCKDHHRILLSLNMRVVHDASGTITAFEGTGEDITTRKRTEESLQHSEERFRQVVENIREVFWMTDPKKKEMIYISPAYEEIWGRSRASLYASPRDWMDAIHPDDRERVLKAALRKQASGEYHEIYRIARPDGSFRWIEDRAFPVRNKAGEVYRITGIAEDITERKQAEQLRQRAEAELQHLPGRIIEAQEAERFRVARELHDGVNQVIASAKMRLRQVANSKSISSPAAREILSRCEKLLVQALEENRRIAQNLRPTDLDNLGLVAACRTFLKQVQSRAKLTVQCHLSRLSRRCPLPVELNLFRIVQEAVTNVEKHAHAKMVRVRLAFQDNSIVLRIQDNGRGFDPRHSGAGKRKRRGIGLTSMRERAAVLGGTCEVESGPHRGTTIIVRVPCGQAK